MGRIEDMLKEKQAMIPDVGFNLVGLDTFGLPDEQGLFLISHYATKPEAEAEKRKREEANPDTRYFIYGPQED